LEQYHLPRMPYLLKESPAPESLAIAAASSAGGVGESYPTTVSDIGSAWRLSSTATAFADCDERCPGERVRKVGVARVGVTGGH
jgi:hypothetical protein